MSINKISDTVRKSIINKSVNPLPNNPGRAGFRAEDIKKAMFGFVTDERDSIYSEINRVVEEINESLEKCNQNNYSKTDVDKLLKDKVDTEKGKGLSTNDYSTEEKNKLSSLQNYDDSVVKTLIATLQQTKADKTEIPDISSFITKTVNDLVNYYKKNETYSRSEINSLVSAIPKFAILVVKTLPTTNISESTIYLVANGTENQNLYIEYIYVNSKWEKLGEQKLDLSGYSTIDGMNTAISNALNSYYTKTEIDTIKSELNSSISKKLSKNVGKENSGKIIVIDVNGLISFEDMPKGATVLEDIASLEDKNDTVLKQTLASAYMAKEINQKIGDRVLKNDNIISGYGTCPTAAATSAKVVTIADTSWKLKVGTIIGVKFTNKNSASNVTLNVNNTGAKSIWYNNTKYTGNSVNMCGSANIIIYYMYDGTYWVWLSNSVNANTDTIPSISWTVAGTADKTASYTGYQLLSKSYFNIVMVNSNTAKSKLTLNVNGKGAKTIYINGKVSSATNYTLPAGSYFVYYDGTNYYFNTNGTIPNNAGLPLGSIIQSAIPLTDAGVHILDGTTISTEGIYSEFVTYLKAQVTAGYNLTCTQAEFDADVAKTGNCGKFVLNETAKTLRLPKITRFVQGLTNLTDIGKSLEAGLPNITGYAQSTNGSGYFWEENYSGGAFYPDTTRTKDYRLSDSKATGYPLGFDASKSNTIYGKSTTVQPSATEYPYYIVLATTTKTNVQVNIDKIASDLNLKVDKNSLKLYSHTLHLRGDHINVILTILNTSSNLFTLSTLKQWLYANGFNGTSYDQAMYECSGSTLTGYAKYHGISSANSATGTSFGCFYSDNDGDHYTTQVITSIIDTVVQIL